MLAALLLLLAADPNTGPAQPPAAPAPTAKSDADPTICRSVEEVGSLLRKNKVCMRKSEWREQRETNRQMIDRSQLQRPTMGG